MKFVFSVVAFVFTGLALGTVPVRASDQQRVARPGTLNYVEGQARLGSQSLDASSIGKAELDPGQSLTTQNGKAEILLTPGVFVRLGDSSAASMITAGLTSTRISLDEGEAFVEVDEIHNENNLQILMNGINTQLVKMGLYDFNANLHVVQVLNGQAIVDDGEQSIKVKGGHLVDLSAQPLKAQKFDKKVIEAEDLYRWTSLRSGYLAEANADYAPTYAYGGFGWFGDGWYWDPWFDAYTFLPGDGIFYSPFGWGFYSPWSAFGSPLFGEGHYYHHFSPTSYGTWGPGAHYRAPVNYGHGVHYASGFSPHGLPRGGGLGWFHGGSSGFHSGGFHGGGFHGSAGGGFHSFGGGGFHGGGFGGGGGGHH